MDSQHFKQLQTYALHFLNFPKFSLLLPNALSKMSRSLATSFNKMNASALNPGVGTKLSPGSRFDLVRAEEGEWRNRQIRGMVMGW